MGKLAAIVTSNHICPMTTGGTPHVGGPILGPGAAGVTIDGQPAAIVGDICTCCGPPDSVVQGAEGVLINGVPLAVQGSLTAHGGQIVEGSPGVIVGAASNTESTTEIDGIFSNEQIKEDRSDDPLMFTGCSDNPLVERENKNEIEKSEAYKLSSDFAHKNLLSIADDLGEVNFIAFMIKTFGKKISIEAYSKLYRALSERKVDNIPIEVTSNRITGSLAAFDKNNNTIYVSETLLKSAIDDNDKRGMLLTALTEEFGHYMDNLLRNEFSKTDNPDTDYIDAGAVYAYNLFFLDTFNEAKFHFADTESPEYSGQLILDLTEIHTELKSYVEQKEQFDPTPNPEIDFFGAGRVDQKKYEGAMGHQDIVDALDDDGETYFNSDEVLKIYYGNWLRDLSQVILGTTIRLSKKGQEELKKKYPKNKQIKQLLESMPSKLTPEGMVRLVHIAAIKEFEYKVQKDNAENRNQNFDHSFITNEANFNRRFGKLTPEILGIYRPEEHIDNPKRLMDESNMHEYRYGDKTITLYKGKYDQDGKLLPQYSKDSHLEIDLKKGVKRYIVEDFGKDYPSALTYMLRQLKEAMAAGRTTKGFRHLGAALHVLEDYFAHTNFVEISLIKTVDPKTYPWIQFVKETTFAPASHEFGSSYLKNDGTAVVIPPYYTKEGDFYSMAKHLPVVTGLFGQDDTAASVLPKLADILFEIDFEPYRKPKAGDRTFNQMAIIAILSNLAEGQKEDGAKENEVYMGKSYATWLSLFNKYLDYLDYKASKIQEGGVIGTSWEWYDRFFSSIAETLTWFTNFAFNLLTHSTNEDIGEEQTLHSNKNYGTDPTHTQIAKDPPEHHFNPLAGQLAQAAIKEVAKELIRYWNTGRGQQIVLDTASGFFVHPLKCDWQDEIVKRFAKTYPAKVERGHHSTEVAHHHECAQKKLTEFNTIYKDINDYFNNK